jgi:hypothetical protein
MGRRVLRLDEADPKGLIRESYAIEGISDAECRSIFMDWAMSLPAGKAPGTAPGKASGKAVGKPATGGVTGDQLRVLIAHYAMAQPDHPMSQLLNAALLPVAAPRRRGGRTGRAESR